MQEFQIDPQDAGGRLDKYIFKLLPYAAHSLIYKQLRNKNITLNRKKATGMEVLVEKDLVQIYMADATIEKFKKNEASKNTKKQARDSIKKSGLPALSVIYEDANILIANKPVGVLSQKATPNDISMNELLTDYLQESGYQAGLTFRPAFCNRLDRNTSGILLGALTLQASQLLSSLLKERNLTKLYHAIVLGKVTKPIHVKGYLHKDEATNKVTIYNEPVDELDAYPIETAYRPIAYDEARNLTLLEVDLITGKTHQIRAHLAHMGHPILGDYKYGRADYNQKFQVKSQLLHAASVQFHALAQPWDYLSHQCFQAPVPESFHTFFN